MGYRTNFIIVGMVVLVVVFGAAQALRDFHFESVTGGAITGEIEIETLNEAEGPLVAVLLSAEDRQFKEDVVYLLSEKDGNVLELKETSIPARSEDSYLFIEWRNKLNLLSLYMRKSGEGNTNFEIWGPGNTQIAAGELSDEFKWYHFKVSSEKMSSESYAVFNIYTGDGGVVEIDRALGVQNEDSGLSKLTGMMIGRII